MSERSTLRPTLSWHSTWSPRRWITGKLEPQPPHGDGLRQDPLDDRAEDVGEAVVAALVLVGQPLVVDAQEGEDRGVEVVDVDAVGGDAVAERVGRAVGEAR